ncbi:hypothetical protein PV08_07754 [Exophiala spinifera]|uniref:Uncharacterized protein n=1 Tax=Exophiala spinifera TaxID=91928 RepID=A0A0D1ZQB9_9EURO|nr:uncharacterized protein PV08_07754 [Exophiala spinifera]KIW14967.1 hypothetical protein PV08_07754 [Exophiala spinifera]
MSLPTVASQQNAVWLRRKGDQSHLVVQSRLVFIVVQAWHGVRDAWANVKGAPRIVAELGTDRQPQRFTTRCEVPETVAGQAEYWQIGGSDLELGFMQSAQPTAGITPDLENLRVLKPSRTRNKGDEEVRQAGERSSMIP